MDSEKTQTVGETLRQARERKGVTIGDVAAEIMVPQHYLTAIEEDRYAELPGQTYAIGFVRNYSRYLCLPPTDIIDQLKTEFSFPKTLDSSEIASGFVSSPKRNVLPSGASIVSGLCVAIGVYGLWFAASATTPSAALPAALPDVVLAPSFAKGQVVAADVSSVSAFIPSMPAKNQPSQVEIATVSQPAYAPADASLQTAAAEKVGTVIPEAGVGVAEIESLAEPVTIHVAEESWVEVHSEGLVHFAGLKQAGETLNITAEQAMTAQLTTGNAGGIWLSVGDWTSQTLGAQGKVRRNIALAPERLRERFAAADRS